jgi:hypothetical protein
MEVLPVLRIPGLRDDLHGIDLIVAVCSPSLWNHAAPNVSGEWLGECIVRPADGRPAAQSLCFRRGDEAAWNVLHRAYTLREQFRAVRSC